MVFVKPYISAVLVGFKGICSRGGRKESGMAEVYVVQSKVRALAKKKGFRCSGDAVGALSKLVEAAVVAAGARAKANKRQTIKASDV
jgi:histone H3/H4